MAVDILEKITTHKRIEVERLKEQVSLQQIYKAVEAMLDVPVPSMRKALMESETGIIAEFKRKSPSKGWIKEAGRADEIPLSYWHNGASAVSILTDEMYFGGQDDFITTARRSGVDIPILYKNFVIDEYQLFQARRCGASAVLLIAACLTRKECGILLHTAHELGLEVLLEMHAEREIDYAELEPDMYGVNNRNLGTFVTDVQNSFNFAARLPRAGCKVSESGISNPATIRSLRLAGYRGFLIGECFMKADNPGEELKKFIDALRGE